MMKRFITYIEQEPWDEDMERQQRWLDRTTIIVIILAVVYFGPVIIRIIVH